jgi:hypothetical protein
MAMCSSGSLHKGYDHAVVRATTAHGAAPQQDRPDAGQGGSVHTGAIKRCNSWRAAAAWVARSCQPASMDRRLA